MKRNLIVFVTAVFAFMFIGFTNVSAKGVQVTLGAGTHTVGEDIKPGRYVIKSLGGSGNLMDNTGDNLNTILSDTVDNDDGYVTSFTTYLKKGHEIEINDMQQVQFTPITKKQRKATKKAVKQGQELNAGNYKVGKDIKAGKYEISAVEGSGNLATDDAMVNAILGTTADSDSGQVTHVSAHLYKGQTLSTDLQGIKLQKK